MTAPKVSIVTPTYNRADLLPETIESILSQSYQDFEYIVIDDGSTDDTAKVLERYGDRLIRRYHENMGEAFSTNRGWQEARGEYFAMVSSDDPMKRDWLECAVSFMDANPDVLVGYPDWHMIDMNSQVLQTVRVYEFSPDKLFGWVHCLPGPGSIIRKAQLGPEFLLRSPQLRYISDLESWFRLGLIGRFARIPKVLSTWRLHPDSVSIAVKSLERSRETISVVREFYRREDLPEEIACFRRMAMGRAYYLAAVFVRDTAPLYSFVFLMRSVFFLPRQPKDFPTEIRRASIFRIFRAIWK